MCIVIGAAAVSFAETVTVQNSVTWEQQPAVVQQPILAQLEQKHRRLDRHMMRVPNNKGPALAFYMDERARLDNLINRINAGQPVDPDEINYFLY